MEREEIERVERELDAILKLVQPEPTMQDKAREEALSKEPVSGGDKTTSEEYLTEEGTLEAYLFGDDSSEENASEYDAADKYAADKYAANKYAADKYAVDKYAVDKYAADKYTADKYAADEYAADKYAADKYAADKYAADNYIADRYTADEYTSEEDEYGMEEENETAGQDRQQYDKRETGMSQTENRRGLRLLKPSDGLVAAFFVPVVAMIIIFAQRGIFPFGEECFLRTDMYHQYAPFFSEFQYKLTHGGSLLYSWDIGMGVNFSALYAYYLASPVNWLLILCPKKFIIEFMTILIVLKTGLSGLSFSWYLKKHFGVKKFGVGFFGIFYALSGYMAAYSWNIMWLDCIMLFPLILLGLEQLVKEKKGTLYCITLGLSILSNYYISIMICIFMVIYVIAQMTLNPPKSFGEFMGTGLRFAFYSLLAGGLAAVVLLPEIYALQVTASGDFDFPKTFSSYFSIFDMIARHIGNVGTEIGLDHWPNIYCGVAVLMFFLLYLGSRKITFREKAVYCSMLVLFYASFSVNVLNFIWHGFHYPNSLPCRQSFIYIALMLFMCYHAYIHLQYMSWKSVCLAFWGAVSFVLLAEKLVDNPEQYHFSVFYAALLFIAIYGGLIYLYHKGKWSLDAILLTALAVVAIEAAVNTAVTSIPTTSRTSYVKDNQDVEDLVWNIKSDTFYRVEKTDRKTKNDGAWMNFPSVSLFSSTANASLSDFFRRMGCESSTNAYSITGSTPLVDSLMSVRYGIYGDQQPADGLRDLSGRKGSMWLYENKFTLPVAFMLPSDVEGNWILDSGNPAHVQNDLCDVLDTEHVLLPNESVTEGRKLTFTAQETGDYYVYVTNKKVKEVTAVIGEQTVSFDNVDRGYFMELGRINKDVEVRLETGDDGSPTLQAEVWRFNPQALEAVYGKMNQNPMVLSRWTDTELSGSITAESAGVMYTSIPYDKGWTILVDGKAVTPRKMFDTFLAVDIGEGTHRISFSYEPEGLRTGAWITGASAAVLGVTVLVGISRKKKKNRAVSGYSIRKKSKENKKGQKKENSSKQESSGK